MSARILGVEIGVNDYLVGPIDENDLSALARTQVRKKRYSERPARSSAALHGSHDH